MHYDTHTRHNQPGTVAVVLDPDGGEHPCFELSHPVDDAGNPFLYWCAGMTSYSPGELANRLWDQWFAPSEPVREWDEARALEAMVP